MELNENYSQMNARTKSKTEFIKLCHEAVNCRECFRGSLKIQSPDINGFNIAQPRWVGPSYWNAKPRILIVMLNPGSGFARNNKTTRNLFKEFAISGNEKKLQAGLESQRKDMPYWGKSRQFLSFYKKMVPEKFIQEDDNFRKDKIAFANIAWCADKDNKHPQRMLNHCFKTKKYTKRLVEILKPDVVILSGKDTHKYADEIKKTLPDSVRIKTIHFANRGSPVEKEKEQKRVKKKVIQTSRPTKNAHEKSQARSIK